MNTTTETVSSQTPAIPQELVDTIIDHSHSDRQLLGTCALVCRSWVPPSRYHLFNSIAIRKENATALLDLLQSQLITFLPYLQGLTFFCNADEPTDAPRIWHIASVLPQLLAHCPLLSVRSITFKVDCDAEDGCRHTHLLSDQESELLTNLPSSCPNVTSLHLDSVRFVSAFFESLSKFKRLEHLYLMTDSLCESVIDYAKLPPPVQLQSIAVEQPTWGIWNGMPDPNKSGLVQVVDWITSGGKGPKIQRLRVTCTEPHELASVGSFLRFLGGDLQVLDITFNDDCRDLVESYVDLTSNPNLHSMHLYLSTSQPDHIVASAPLIMQVSSHLTHLKLSLVLLDDQPIDVQRQFLVDLSASISVAKFHLELLDCHLELFKYTELEGDDVVSYLEGMAEECKNHLREFDEMGVLRIVLDGLSKD